MNSRRADREDSIPSFLADEMLGALARHLRMLGFDVEYCRSGDMSGLVRLAGEQGRWLLTRRRMQARDQSDIKVLQIHDDDPQKQVVQVLRSLSTSSNRALWFTRCLSCNRALERIPRDAAVDAVPEFVAWSHQEFHRCPSCARIFWSGSHSAHMRARMEQWIEEARGKSAAENQP